MEYSDERQSKVAPLASERTKENTIYVMRPMKSDMTDRTQHNKNQVYAN